MNRARAAGLVLAVLLAGCGGNRDPGPRSAPTGATAGQATAPCACPDPAQKDAGQPKAPKGQLLAAQWRDLPAAWLQDAGPSLAAFRHSCSVLNKRPAWQAVCAEAQRLDAQPESWTQWLQTRFTPYQVRQADGSDTGLVTGYYEPLLDGSLTRTARHTVPIWGEPTDLITVELAAQHPELKGMRLRGRLVGNKLVPYGSRADIEAQGNQFPARAIAWVEDPVALFFLQVQGSGRIKLPSGEMIRLGYANQNGHPYKSIGRYLVDQGELTLDQASAQSIQAWAKANPRRLNELLNANPSYVFFRRLEHSGGPLGALGVPLTDGYSIAIDPSVVPLGVPVVLDTTHPLSQRPLVRLVQAQDTGGAIRGGVRADFFWGFGPAAGEQAGKMKQAGRMWILWPNGSTPPAPQP